MPVVIDRGVAGHGALAAAERASAASRHDFRETDCIDVAFINNMPDKALEATERQFLKLLAAAAKDVVVRVKFYSLPDVPRTEWGHHHLRARYAPLGDLWNGRHDGLIVTGTEPRADDLAAEPYWAALTDVVDWAEQNVASAVWSCLAAHAAVRHRDGIRRRSLDDKCFGVFECSAADAGAADHALMHGVGLPLWIPHSRWNDLAEDELTACGYRVLTRSAVAGVDTFVKQEDSLFVFFQGHPEYEPEALLREYRRDVLRFLKAERDSYPAIPAALVDQETAGRLTAFRDRAVADRRAELITAFPVAAVATDWTEGWHASAARIYRNWLSLLSGHKAQTAGRARCAPRRRSTARR
jgi:homoserine O-succinyltransferase